MADQGPLTGKLLGGRYLLHERLGSGGFADVYRSEHRHLKTIHAVKVLTRQLSASEIEQFRAEAQTIAALAHPHILRVSDFDLDNGVPFLVMDYAPGGTLRQQHPPGSRVPLATVVQYVRQVAEALQHAHDERRIHRDIKPQNLLLGRQSEVLLSDFGIAVIAQSTSQLRTEGYSGTAAYSAPEQILGKPRPASDQYALGVMVYEWLAGRLPFQGGMVEMIGQHLNAPVPPLRASAPDLTPAIEQVVLKALAKDPKDRFPNVRELAEALEQAYEISLRPPLGTMLVAYRGHTGPIHAVAWSSDSKHIASASSDGIQVWDSTTGQRLFAHAGEVSAVVWSPDSKRLAYATFDTHSSFDSTIRVWDATNGQQLPTRSILPAYVRTLTWMNDERCLACLSGSITNDGIVAENEFQVWNALTSRHLFTCSEHSDQVFTVMWSPDGQRIASSLGRTVQVWDAATGQHLLNYTGHAGAGFALDWSPDCSQIVSVGTTKGLWKIGDSAWKDTLVHVWDITTGQHLHTYSGHSSGVLAVAWSPDGKSIASTSSDGTVQIWDAANSQHVFTYKSHSTSVTAVAWSPDGTRIASASYDGTVQMWSAG